MKFEFYKDTKELMIYNKREFKDINHYEFIGKAIIEDLDDNLMALDNPVARPKFGNLLYQAAMMYAQSKNKHLCLTRSGDIREAAMNPFEKIKNEFNKGNSNVSKINVPEKYNDEIYEWTNEDDTPVLFEAFNLTINENFEKSFNILNKKEYSFLPIEKQEEWSHYFRYAYENDSNKFIDEDDELSKPIDPSEFLSIKESNSKKNKFKIK